MTLKHPFPDGTRVRNYGEQYGKAITHGTGEVVRHFYVGPWLEYEVRRDDGHPLNADCGPITQWSYERTVAADVQP